MWDLWNYRRWNRPSWVWLPKKVRPSDPLAVVQQSLCWEPSWCIVCRVPARINTSPLRSQSNSCIAANLFVKRYGTACSCYWGNLKCNAVSPEHGLLSSQDGTTASLISKWGIVNCLSADNWDLLMRKEPLATPWTFVIWRYGQIAGISKMVDLERYNLPKIGWPKTAINLERLRKVPQPTL